MVRALPHPINRITTDICAPTDGHAVLPVRSSAVDKVACLFSHIHHLETINLAFYSSYGDTPDIDSTVSLALQTSVLGALATSYSVRAPPNLVSLSLCNLRT